MKLSVKVIARMILVICVCSTVIAYDRVIYGSNFSVGQYVEVNGIIKMRKGLACLA